MMPSKTSAGQTANVKGRPSATVGWLFIAAIYLIAAAIWVAFGTVAGLIAMAAACLYISFILTSGTIL